MRRMTLMVCIALCAPGIASCGEWDEEELDGEDDDTAVDSPEEDDGKLLPQAGGFSGSCTRFWLEHPLGPTGERVILSADCRNNAGQVVYAGQIHLDWIVKNEFGRLRYINSGYGGYQNSCRNCKLWTQAGRWVPGANGAPFWSVTFLEGFCEQKGTDLFFISTDCLLHCGGPSGGGCGNGAGAWWNTFVSLDACIANYNGRLAYVC
jgi:hypothetical protein